MQRRSYVGYSLSVMRMPTKGGIEFRVVGALNFVKI